jgi:hypothetical protein
MRARTRNSPSIMFSVTRPYMSFTVSAQKHRKLIKPVLLIELRSIDLGIAILFFFETKDISMESTRNMYLF